MIYKFTIVFLPAFGIGYCAVPDLLPPSGYDQNIYSYMYHHSFLKTIQRMIIFNKVSHKQCVLDYRL